MRSGVAAVLLMAGAVSATFSGILPAVSNHEGGSEMKANRLTPILLVDDIEACLDFWVDGLGFARETEVPDGDRLGFVILKRDGVELMYQSRASVVADIEALGSGPLARDGMALYLEVSDLKAAAANLPGAVEIFPERETFYGSREMGVRAPCGTTVILAEFGAASEQ